MGRQALPLSLTAAVTLAFGLALGSAAAEARERGHAAQRPAHHGQHQPRGDYTRHTERQRTGNGHVRRDTWQGADGRTASRTATVVNDRDAGVRTREAVTTLPDGRTRTLSDVVTRTEDGYARETSVTNPNGSTVQRDVQASYDPATKTWSKDVSVDRTPAPAGD